MAPRVRMRGAQLTVLDTCVGFIGSRTRVVSYLVKSWVSVRQERAPDFTEDVGAVDECHVGRRRCTCGAHGLFIFIFFEGRSHGLIKEGKSYQLDSEADTPLLFRQLKYALCLVRMSLMPFSSNVAAKITRFSTLK